MTIRQESVSLDSGRRMIDGAEEQAPEIDSPSNIIVYAGGNLVAHVRMNGAWVGSVDVSIDKAFT